MQGRLAVMDDDDPVDTMPKIEEECRPSCSKVCTSVFILGSGAMSAKAPPIALESKMCGNVKYMVTKRVQIVVVPV